MRPVRADEWRRLREVRLRALASDPHAFSTTHDHAAKLTDEEWQLRASASADDGQSCYFVAVVDPGHWVGIAFVIGFDDSDNAGLFSMWVAPAVRRAGVARALCDACAAWAIGREYAGLILGVMADNGGAQAAYRSMGFTEYDRTTEAIGADRRELVMMHRPLG